MNEKLLAGCQTLRCISLSQIYRLIEISSALHTKPKVASQIWTELAKAEAEAEAEACVWCVLACAAPHWLGEQAEPD